MEIGGAEKDQQFPIYRTDFLKVLEADMHVLKIINSTTFFNRAPTSFRHLQGRKGFQMFLKQKFP